MRLLASLESWLKSRRPKPLSELLAVEFDDETVRVIVIDRMEPGWNQEFKWSDITRVCFKDEGISASDILFMELKGRERPAMVLMEAKGGPEFFGQIVERKLLPEHIWRHAVGSSNGGMYCWPPRE